MECPRCAADLEGRPNYCGQCGFVLAVVHLGSDAQAAGRVPRCPSCRGPVRAGEYPRRLGANSVPWNDADWRGVCDQCGFQFSMTHELDSQSWMRFHPSIPKDLTLPPNMRLRRRVVARPASDVYFQGHELHLHLAGIEISVEDESFGYPPRSERYFLTKEEAAWLVRALQGSLAISFEQYHYDLDVT